MKRRKNNCKNSERERERERKRRRRIKRRRRRWTTAPTDGNVAVWTRKEDAFSDLAKKQWKTRTAR